MLFLDINVVLLFCYIVKIACSSFVLVNPTMPKS